MKFPAFLELRPSSSSISILLSFSLFSVSRIFPASVSSGNSVSILNLCALVNGADFGFYIGVTLFREIG